MSRRRGKSAVREGDKTQKPSVSIGFEEGNDTEAKVTEEKMEVDSGVAKDGRKKDADLAIYNLDGYDDSSDEEEEGENATIFTNLKNMAYHNPEDKDPYVTFNINEEEAEETEDALHILPSDNLLVTAKTEDDVSFLEIFVYEGTR